MHLHLVPLCPSAADPVRCHGTCGAAGRAGEGEAHAGARGGGSCLRPGQGDDPVYEDEYIPYSTVRKKYFPPPKKKTASDNFFFGSQRERLSPTAWTR